MSVISKTYNGLLLQFPAIGDTKDFSIEVPLRGWTQLTSASLTTTGTTVTRYLDIYASYTLDGLNYTNFAPLSSITAPIRSDFIVILRFVRAGVDNTGSITLTALTLNGDFQQTYYNVWDLSGTVFADVLYEDVRCVS